MVLDEELDQAGILAADAVSATEAACLDGTEVGVVAAAALGHVVEEGGDVEDPRRVELRRQLRAEGVLVRVLGDEEAPHVAQHHQDVLVHGVDVEQVVLHAADDAAEHPEVAPQHRGLVHEPQHVGDALRLAQDLHEALAIGRVVPEVRAHHVAGVVQRAQRACRQALDARCALVDEEGAQDGGRVLDVELVSCHLQHAAAVEELGVDRPHRRVFRAVDALLDVEHQDLVELRDRLGRPVVAVHQHLGAALGPGGAVAEALGHGRLQVEDQAVLAAAGHHVQPCPDQLERALVLAQLRHLEGRDQAVGRHLAPGAAEAGRARHPDDHLQVTQASRALLAVGLERVGRALVLDVPLQHLQRLGAQEGPWIQHFGLAPAKALEHAALAAHQP